MIWMLCSLSALLLSHKVKSTVRTSTYIAETPLDTYKFTSFILSEEGFEYGELCFIKCNQLPNCKALVVSFKSGGSNCVLYSKRFEVNDITDATHSENFRYFYLPKVTIFVCQGTGFKQTSLGYCMKVEPRHRYTKSQAETVCQSSGGRLVIINTPSKQSDIAQLLQTDAASGVLWNGGYWDTVNKLWKWWDGSLMPMGSTYWKTRQPDNHRNAGNEDCVVAGHSDFRWNDITCTLRRGYVCEKPLTPILD